MNLSYLNVYDLVRIISHGAINESNFVLFIKPYMLSNYTLAFRI